MARHYIIQDWQNAAEYSGEMIGRRLARSQELFLPNGKANIALFADEEPKAKKKKSVADSIDLSERHYQRMEAMSEALDEEYFAGEIDEERYQLLRYKMNERLLKAWKRLEKDSLPVWQKQEEKQAASGPCGVALGHTENAYNSGKSLLKQHIATDYSIIPSDRVFSHLSDGNIFKIFAAKLLTAKRSVAKMYTVVKQIVEEGLL